MPQRAELAAAHRALFAHPIAAAREHVELALLGQQFDFHALAHLLPRLFEQRRFEFAEPALRRADQIRHRRLARPHLGEHLLGRNAAIHHPNALGLAVLCFDLREKISERCLVRGVARQHLVSEWKTLRCDHQRDHHLHAIGPLVAAVAKAPFAAVAFRRIAFEIRARQIIEQHLETRAEEIAPSLLQVGKKRPLVLKQLVQTAIERVLFHQGKVAPEQIAHRALLKPEPMQAPLAARIDEPVTHQRLQDVAPASSLAAVGQPLDPERLEPELRVELAGQPARAPLPWPMQLHRLEPHLHPEALRVRRHLTVRGKKRQRPRGLAQRIKRLDRATPRRALAVIDLAQIEHRALHDLAARAAPVLDDRPVAMRLAVFAAPIAFEEHDRERSSAKTPR